MSFPVINRWIGITLVTLGIGATSQAQNVVINEVFADNRTNLFSDGSISDWVELYNPSSAGVNLAGYSLTDAATTPRKWVVPANVTIGAGGYLVVLLDSNRAASTTAGPVLNAGFGIRATGDRIELYSAASQLVQSVRFGPQVRDYTLGRIPAGTGNFVLTRPTPLAGNVAQTLGTQSALRINEWMASPASGRDWFEVYNPGPLPVELTGLYFTDSNNQPSPVTSYSFIGSGLNGFLQIFADNSTSDNEVDFGLGGGGDSIGVHFANGALINQVLFGPQTANVSEGRLPDGSDTVRSLNTPTPGESNLIRYEGLVVSELLSHTDPPLEDAIEFYNQSDAPLNIGGWFLSDSRNELKKFRIPDGTVVPARGYVVFYQNQFDAGAGAFSFNSSQGDEVYLAQAVNGELTGFIVSESFEASANGISFGRVDTSVPGDYKFVALAQRTFGQDNPATVEQFRTGTGAANAGPRVGPIVINEIMYNPLSPDGATANNVDEFVELLNISGSSVGLFDPAHPENRWVLRGGVIYSFPANTTVPAGAAIVIVSFDPADAPQLTAFRAKYSVPANTLILGPYLGRLGNGGDEVELYQPDPPQLPGQPDAGFVPYIRVDKVNYADTAPWPTTADGTGNSLQRKTAAAFGNDPANWNGAAPTAGRSNSAETGLTLAISRASGVSAPVVLQFPTVAGQSYTVQSRSDLQPATAWQALSSTNATGGTATIQDSGVGDSQRFYRVVTPAVN